MGDCPTQPYAHAWYSNAQHFKLRDQCDMAAHTNMQPHENTITQTCDTYTWARMQRHRQTEDTDTKPPVAHHAQHDDEDERKHDYAAAPVHNEQVRRAMRGTYAEHIRQPAKAHASGPGRPTERPTASVSHME